MKTTDKDEMSSWDASWRLTLVGLAMIVTLVLVVLGIDRSTSYINSLEMSSVETHFFRGLVCVAGFCVAYFTTSALADIISTILGKRIETEIQEEMAAATA